MLRKAPRVYELTPADPRASGSSLRSPACFCTCELRDPVGEEAHRLGTCRPRGPGRPGDSTRLHSGLDDVQGSVSEHAGGPSDGAERTGYHGVNGLVGVIPLVIHRKQSFWSSKWELCVCVWVCYCRLTHTFVPVPQHSHDVEADGLVGALFQHGGRQTLIGPLQP